MIQDGNFAADTVIVDGFDFYAEKPGALTSFKQFAEELGLALWFSASLRGDEPLFDDRGVPLVLEGCADLIDLLITLTSQDDYIHLNLVKDRGKIAQESLRLKLDSKSLLIAEE